MQDRPQSATRPLELVATRPGRGGQDDRPAIDDATLVARMRTLDESALGLLYDRYEDVVRTAALRIVGDSMEAEDVVEDVFWQAWRQADRFDATRGGAVTWLLTIARTRALDRLRALKRSREIAGLDELEEIGGDAAASAQVDPQAVAELAERSRMVREAMNTLPAEQRESLELGYFEGLSQSEIAERTGEPLGTVKTRMRLAMQKLREQLPELREKMT